MRDSPVDSTGGTILRWCFAVRPAHHRSWGHKSSIGVMPSDPPTRSVGGTILIGVLSRDSPIVGAGGTIFHRCFAARPAHHKYWGAQSSSMFCRATRPSEVLGATILIGALPRNSPIIAALQAVNLINTPETLIQRSLCPRVSDADGRSERQMDDRSILQCSGTSRSDKMKPSALLITFMILALAVRSLYLGMKAK